MVFAGLQRFRGFQGHHREHTESYGLILACLDFTKKHKLKHSIAKKQTRVQGFRTRANRRRFPGASAPRGDVGGRRGRGEGAKARFARAVRRGPHHDAVHNFRDNVFVC